MSCYLYAQFLIIFNWLQYKPLTLGAYQYPVWADVLGWAVVLTPVGVVVGGITMKLISVPGDLPLVQVCRY